MNQFISKGLLALSLVGAIQVSAGNKDRTGQAGGGQLLINPWAQSSGWAGANVACSNGLEAGFNNVAGLAFVNKTELQFNRTNWLKGSDININAFGLAQKVGETGVLGLSIMSMSFGDIEITTEALPDGGIGTFSPSYMNLGLSYSKMFSDAISGGLTVRSISEKISDASANGVCFDMGIRYVTGEFDNVKFGISLRNVGPKMQFTGDGFAQKVTMVSMDDVLTLENRTEPFELPSLLNIGFAYDYYIGLAEDSVSGSLKSDHKITGAAAFTSNSFGKDQIRLGVEYGFKSYLQLRLGYLYEEGIGNVATSTTAYTGMTAGVGFELPMGSDGTVFGLNYSYRPSNPFSGSHTIGARISL